MTDDLIEYVDDSKRGVYAILCKPTETVYVGSSVDVEKRWQAHRSALRAGKHYNAVLQFEWDEHGERAFEFQVQQIVRSPELLAPVEQAFIDRFGTANRLSARVGGPGKTYCLSDDTYAKICERALDRELLKDWAELELAEEWKAAKRLLPVMYEPNLETRRARWREWNAAVADKIEQIRARHLR